MFWSLNEINEKLQKLREQRARINEMIDYYEFKKQQVISEQYRDCYVLETKDTYKKPIIRY